MRLIDLSHAVADGRVTYPGLPAPQISPYVTFEESHANYSAGTEFEIKRISMVANTGTYLDTPAHRYRDGHDLAGLPLQRCAMLPCVVVDVTDRVAIDEHAVAGVAGLGGAAVLLHTGWDRHWGSADYGDPGHPYLTQRGARALVEAGATLVGIDSVNIDATAGGDRPAHSVLLAAEIPVVEHLTRLGEVPARGATFTAAPVRIEGMGTFPVRAFAAIDD